MRMNLNSKNVFLLSVVLLIGLAVTANAALPSNIQQGADDTRSEALKVTLLIAFLGGMLSMLSPCLLPILPAFFAYAFREKKEMAKMALVFFLGFSVIFISYGIASSIFGNYILDYGVQFAPIGGILLIILGIMALAGRGFGGFVKMKGAEGKKDTLGIFIGGMALALGWTPCVGPTLSGILIASAVYPVPYAALMLFVYSLGIFVPLILLALLYDRFNLGKMLAGKEKILNAISGILLISLGLLLLTQNGTATVNAWDIFGTKQFFYEWQREIVKLGQTAEIISVLLIAALAYLIWKRFGRKEYKGGNT